jgi:predicted metalloprotease with PDZ domain
VASTERRFAILATLGVLALAALGPVHSIAGVAAEKAGSIRLDLDAREIDRKIIHVREVIPVRAGELTLYYPKWIPGEHGPTGPIGQLAGLRVEGVTSGKPLEWRRDLADMYAIHCDIPEGESEIAVTFDVLTTPEGSTWGPEVSASSQLALLNFNQCLLYPSGVSPDSVMFTAGVMLPKQWRSASALPPSRTSVVLDSWGCAFAPVSLTRLVDSPVLMGRFTRRVELNAGDAKPAALFMAADSRAALEVPADRLAHFRAVVAEAKALFGARHYDHYEFLLSLSDHVAPLGLEHHECTDIRDQERSLLDPTLALANGDLYAHEYAHSWNGKYRRPTGLATPDYQTPMTGELLWAYEGLTHYLGFVLGARAGFFTAQEYRDALASDTAFLETERGRDWRPLVDTGVEAQLLYSAPKEGTARRRGVDFYAEGALAWLEADAVLREKSGGRVTLDDFLRRFHGGADSAPRLSPYALDEVLAALNALAPYDWKTFFADRVDRVTPHPPLAALERHGWRLAWRDSSSDYYRALEDYNEEINLEHSIGVKVAAASTHASATAESEAGEIRDVVPGSAAANAGLAPGMKLVAVNGRAWSSEVLHDAVRATAKGEPLELLVSNTEYFHTYALDYHGGERYPWLERIPGRADLLSDVIRPRAATRK